MDDCAKGQSVKNRTSELVKSGFSTRHYNLSVIVITQQLTSIAKPFRQNISKIVTFHNLNKKDMTTIIDDYLATYDRTAEGKKELDKVLKTLKRKKYSNLEIYLIYPFNYKINDR